MKKGLIIPVGITVAAAVGCAAAILFNKPAGGSTAYVYQDGKEIARLPLDGSADGKTVTITGKGDYQGKGTKATFTITAAPLTALLDISPP